MPIAYIQRTQERYAAFAPYKWAINAEAPWTPLAKPIRDCRLAVITSGGFYLPGQEPFVDNDTSFRVLPKDVTLSQLKIHHHGYRDFDGRGRACRRLRRRFGGRGHDEAPFLMG